MLGRQEESLAVQSIILTAARTAGFAITFAIPIVLVRVFDQEQFGVYKQLFLIAATAIPVLNLGMYASVFYFVPRDEGEGHRYIVQAIGLLSLTGGLAGLGLALAPGEVSRLLNIAAVEEYLPLVGLFVFLSTPSELVIPVPTVDRRPVIAAYTIAASDLLRACGVIGAAVMIRSIEAVLWAVIVVALLRGFWLLIYVRLRRKPAAQDVAFADLIDQLRYSLPFALAVLFEVGLLQFHQFYVAANVSPAEFAIYAIGILQIPVLGFLVQSVVEVMLIRTSAAHKTGDRAEMRRVWIAALERLAVVLVPCWVLAELLAHDLVGFLFGSAYYASVPILRVFLLTVVLWVIVDHGILRATGDTPYLLAANVVGFAASVAAVMFFSRFSVLLGGAAGYVFGLISIRCLGLLRVARRLDMHWWELLPWRTFARVSAAVTLSGLVAASGLALPHRLLRLGLAALLFLVVYAAIVFRWELIPRREMHSVLRRFVPAYRWGS